MKIVQVNKFYYQFGGAERYYFDLTQSLEQQGHTIIPFCMNSESNFESPYSHYFTDNVDFNTIKAKPIQNIRTIGRIIYSHHAYQKCHQLIKIEKPDIAHIHNIYHQLSTSVISSFYNNRVPMVMTLHDYKVICPNYSLFTENTICTRCKNKNYINAFFHKCLKSSRAVSLLAAIEMYFVKIIKQYENKIQLFIVPSQCMYDLLCSFGFPKHKLRVTPHAINLNDFYNTHTTLSKEDNSVLYYGKLYNRKGIDSFITVAKHFPNYVFNVIGDGPYQQPLEKHLKELKITNVRLLGFKNKLELIPFIQKAKAVIVPSQWYEVTGLIVYESFALKKCVVASRIGALPELIEDGRTGFLFDPFNTNDLKEKLSHVLSNDQERKNIGNNAFSFINNFNNIDTHRNSIVSIYEEVRGKSCMNK